jgi:hypothetical protein
MARYGTRSRLESGMVLDKAKSFFGARGLGLRMMECDDSCIYFVGGGGHVLVEACELEKGSEVELETREWDYHVRRFMSSIAV